ncbi:MAG: hypothetical protein ACLUN0_00380 [Roseburia sp.]
MKTIKAFAVSLLLCALTIVGLHLYSGRGFSAEEKQAPGSVMQNPKAAVH